MKVTFSQLHSTALLQNPHVAMCSPVRWTCDRSNYVLWLVFRFTIEHYEWNRIFVLRQTALFTSCEGNVKSKLWLCGYWVLRQVIDPLEPSGHYMYRQFNIQQLYVPWLVCIYRTVITICTASLTFNNSTFCPHSVFMCFVWISEQTAINSLYNINLLVCITETECVYCAVRTGSFIYVYIYI